MAAWSARASLLMIAGVILLAIIVRYPLVDHERFQTDSYFIHALSQSIVDNEHARWTFHSLSYFGYYPVSYPSGYPVLLSELAILTGMTVEGSILASTFVLGALFSFVMFCLGRDLLQRTDLALLVMVLATLAPRFVDTTYWNGSARGPETVMLSMLLLVVVRASMMRSRCMLAVSLPVIFACFSLHHMAILIILVGLAAVLTYQIVERTSRISGRKRRMHVRASALLLVLAGGIAYMIMSPSASASLRNTFGTGYFSSDTGAVSILLNMGVSYVHQIGLILLLMPIGFYLTYVRAPTSMLLYLPTVALLAFVPVLDKSLYVSLLILPFACITGVLALGQCPSKANRQTRVLIMGMVVVLSGVVCALSVDRWNGQTFQTGDHVTVENQVICDAQYLRVVYGSTPSIANQGVLQSQVGALSQLEFVDSTMYLALSGDMTADDLRSNITVTPYGFPTNLYLWYGYDDTLRPVGLVHRLFTIGISYFELSSEIEFQFLTANPSMIVIIDNDWPNEYATLYGPYDAVLPSELQDAETATGTPVESYQVYSTSGLSTYIWALPLG